MPDWIGAQPSTDSPYYPYTKVVAGNTMEGAEEIPYRLMKYLMDLPSRGYSPPSHENFPKTKIQKPPYL